MWYSGIDQHKQYCVITTYGPEGPRVKQARVPSTPLALQLYFAEFPGPHQAVVESTGSWYWLADLLAAPEAHMIAPEQRGPRAILDADRNLNGGAHVATLRGIFRRRGIGPVE